METNMWTKALSTDDTNARCIMTVTANTNGGMETIITHVYAPNSSVCICRMAGPFAALARDVVKLASVEPPAPDDYWNIPGVRYATKAAEPVTPEALEADARALETFLVADATQRMATALREYAAILRRQQKSVEWLAISNEPATDEEIASYKRHEGCSGSCLPCLEKFRLIARIEKAEAEIVDMSAWRMRCDTEDCDGVHVTSANWSPTGDGHVPRPPKGPVVCLHASLTGNGLNAMRCMQSGVEFVVIATTIRVDGVENAS
jgi:hypothetical protein